MVGILETLGDEVAKFVDVELRGVDDYISELADGLHEGAFVVKAFAHGQGFSQRMRPARLAVAAEGRVVACVDEDRGDGMIFAKVLQDRRGGVYFVTVARLLEPVAA